MRSTGDQTGQTTTAKMRLEAGKAARFSASAQSTDWFDSCCARGAQFTVARAGRRCDPWPHNHAESGECRFSIGGVWGLTYHQWEIYLCLNLLGLIFKLRHIRRSGSGCTVVRRAAGLCGCQRAVAAMMMNFTLSRQVVFPSS
jgi:hypothetical protein